MTKTLKQYCHDKGIGPKELLLLMTNSGKVQKQRLGYPSYNTVQNLIKTALVDTHKGEIVRIYKENVAWSATPDIRSK